ncbi:MAG: DHHA1 domain-containing protein [Nitrososphaera sp.]
MSDTFADALKHFCEILRATVEEGNEVAIVTHLDADGIASGSIMAMALRRMGARCSVRTVQGMSPAVVEMMKADGRDFYLITDLGGGWSSVLGKVLGNKWLIIDHHELAEEEIMTDVECRILNPWKFGIDGGREVAAGGMAYMVAKALDFKNNDLSPMAIVSAVADRQDQGDKKSLSGLNAEILKTAQTLGHISVDLDIALSDRETRPVHESLAFTESHYIDGLTWNKEACYLLLKNAGIKLKDNSGRWRVLAEFSYEEKTSVVQAVANFVADSDKRLSEIMIGDLMGYVYTLTREDKRSHLRDAREFSTMLNACGRIGRPGVGVTICMGDRTAALTEGEETINTYKGTLRKYLSKIFSEKWRIADDGTCVFINGDGILDEGMLGAVSTFLSRSPSFRDRLLFVRTLAMTGTHRFSSRKCMDCKSKANLGKLMRVCSNALNGEGGGHSAAAGCTIPSSKLEDFIAKIRVEISDGQDAIEPT